MLVLLVKSYGNNETTLASQEPGSESPGRRPCGFAETAGGTRTPLVSPPCRVTGAGWAMAFEMGYAGVMFQRGERGKERTTLTTLHTDTDHIFTALAPRWIPTCWSRAWLATSWQDLYGSSHSHRLSLPRHERYFS